jgi:Crp-like helix-turn-helix domain
MAVDGPSKVPAPSTFASGSDRSSRLGQVVGHGERAEVIHGDFISDPGDRLECSQKRDERVALAHGKWSLVEEPASLTLRFTQEELPAMTGSVREVIQRALKMLEQAGAIQMSRGSVRIVEPPLLERWLRSEGTIEAKLARRAKPRASVLGHARLPERRAPREVGHRAPYSAIGEAHLHSSNRSQEGSFFRT